MHWKSQPLSEGRPSRNSDCARLAGRPGGWTSARTRSVTRRRLPRETGRRLVAAVPGSGAAQTATAARGTAGASGKSTRPSGRALGERHRSRSSRATRRGRARVVRRADAVAGAMAADVDVAVISIATESMAAPFQFLVQFVEHQIAQQWGERATLRSALLGRTDQPIFHHPGAKECPDELEHALVGHPFGHASHQAVLIDSVEKFLEVDVNHHVVAVGDVRLRLGDGLMGRASRPESIAVLGKRRVPLPLEHLQQCLLDQAIDDTGYAEPSDTAARFRDVNPFNRLRHVGPREQLCPDGWPVLPQVGRGVVDGQPVDAGTTLVPTDAFPRFFEIASVAHLLHELVFDSRAVGGSLRRGWFGPWAVGGRGFTP